MTQKYRQIEFFTIDLGIDIVFEIADNGIGIPEEKISQIFNKGFSTKGEENRGYGLAIVKETIDELSGQMEVYNQLDGGVVFSVFIPKRVTA